MSPYKVLQLDMHAIKKVVNILFIALASFPIISSTGCETSAADGTAAKVKEQIRLACGTYNSGKIYTNAFRALAMLDISYLEISLAVQDYYALALALALYSEGGPYGRIVKDINKLRIESGLSPRTAEQSVQQNGTDQWKKGTEAKRKLNTLCVS